MFEELFLNRPDDEPCKDNIWLSPMDHRAIPRVWRRIGWFLLSILHLTVAVSAFLIVIRRFWFQDKSLIKDNYIVGLALANIVVDMVVIGIVVLIYAFVYTMGGEVGVRTTTGIISLLIDGLQTVAYVGVALYAWTISILLLKRNFEHMPRANSEETIIQWIERVIDTLIVAFRYDTVKALFLCSTVILGTFYIIYSTDTVIGISTWLYKKALAPASPFIEFFNPSQRSPYVYLTGPEPYLDSLSKLNRGVQLHYDNDEPSNMIGTELTKDNLERHDLRVNKISQNTNITESGGGAAGDIKKNNINTNRKQLQALEEQRNE